MAKNTKPNEQAVREVLETFERMDWEKYWGNVLRKTAVDVNRLSRARRRSEVSTIGYCLP